MKELARPMAETERSIFESQVDHCRKVDAGLTKDRLKKLSRHGSGR